MNIPVTLDMTQLDYSGIKESIANFMKADPTFTGYNFEGSNLQGMIRVLAYHGMFEAYLAHAGLSESFLSTAQDRRSVVNHAKPLAYTPRSMRSARMTVRTKFVNSSQSVQTIAKGSRVSITADGKNWIDFATADVITIPISEDPVYIDVVLQEGVYTEISYTIPEQTSADTYYAVSEVRLVIPTVSVDTTTLSVTLFSDDASREIAFLPAQDITTRTADGFVYTLQENAAGFYEVVFSRFNQPFSTTAMPSWLKTATFRFMETTGLSANNAFRGAIETEIKATFPDVQNVAITLDSIVEFPFGGQNREDIESVRYNAPMLYQTQNRAVTTADYRALIESNIAGIEALRVVGGETLVPPIYGKILVSLKYQNRTTMPQAVINEIKSLVTKKGIAAIALEFVEPDYTFVAPTVYVKFRTLNKTTTASTVQSKVLTAVSNFGDTQLETFDADLWNIDFLDTVKAADSSIISCSASYSLRKNINIRSGMLNSVNVKFSNKITAGTIRSSSFSYYDPVARGAVVCEIKDDSAGNISVYKLSNTTGNRAITNIGTVDYAAGTIVIKNFKPTGVSTNSFVLTLTADTTANDLMSVAEQILTFDADKITVIVESV